MKLSHIILTAILPFTLVACATTYQPKSFSGGYSETQLDSTTVRVTFEGNGYSNRSTVESYLIYRAAEVTVAGGFDWFVVTEREGETEWHPRAGNIGVMSTAVIKMYRGQKTDGMSRSYDAKSVITTMGPSIKR
tara:strand:+ start:222 stop:623 length:402 start_codon:yes stop_codon:yes gene_type:complete